MKIRMPFGYTTCFWFGWGKYFLIMGGMLQSLADCYFLQPEFVRCQGYEKEYLEKKSGFAAR